MKTTLLAALVLGVACRGPSEPTEPIDDEPPVVFAERATNVLILLLDDLGTDQVAVYDEHPDPPSTPTLDTLAGWGVRFDNAYSYPVCSPARSALLTGRMGRRTGFGDIVFTTAPLEVPEAEVFLPEALAAAPVPWATAAIGKWHLAGTGSADWATHALRQGFDTHRGSPGNLGSAYVPANDPVNYDRWERLHDGELAISERYATTVAVDDALDFVRDAREPWLAVVSFNAAHGPFDPPPGHLTGGVAVADDAPVADRYAAMVTALDAEIGRLLDELDPDVLASTLIIAMGDNGTPSEGVRAPWDPAAAKGTVYEGGIGVPLIVAGAGVAATGARSSALVHVVDVFPTVLELASAPPPIGPDGELVALDGHSLVPLLSAPEGAWEREILVTEMFFPFGQGPHTADAFAVRDETYKLFELRLPGVPVERHLFDLRDRFDDGPDLLEGALDAEASAALQQLEQALAAFEALPYDGL